MYQWAAKGDQIDNTTGFCARLFNEAGKAEFVHDFGGPDCETVVRGLANKVSALVNPPLIDDYGKQVIEISSCHDLRLQPGSMGLGRLTVSRFGTGWVISGHEPEADPCPVTL